MLGGGWDQTHRLPHTAFLSTGGNDPGKVTSEKLFRKYRQSLDKIIEQEEILVVGCVLLERGVCREWLSRPATLNSRLVSHCKNSVYIFIDN